MAWNSNDAKALFATERWSEGLVDIDNDGRLLMRPKGDASMAVPLIDVLERAAENNLNVPLLVRFTDVLAARVQRLETAFDEARSAQKFKGDYGVIYPIKVNQRRSVVEEILEGSERVGLEAGSKPELLAVLAMSRPGGRVICNGYKDAAYVRMALIGQRLGLQVTLVVEKASELDLIMQVSHELGIRPRLGLRLRLSSIGKGKWQNTGGDKAKFGLSPAQILDACQQLRDAESLDCLQLLHFHMGSQISNLRDIHAGASEAVRYYAELRNLGAPIDTLDVGGGLAVDYEGAASRDYFSMNYGIEQYAGTIIRAVIEMCAEHNLPHPSILSESGRALTAHHAVLITQVTAVESGQPEPSNAVHTESATSEPVALALQQLLELIDERPPAEIFQEARFLANEGKQKFLSGQINLRQRAHVDQLAFETYAAVRDRLRPTRRADRNAGEALRRILAHKYFCNLSVFQSLPDVWAIDQVFPILPLTGLDQEPTERAVIEDLTCDSDGRIDFYVESDGLEPTLPVHRVTPDQPYYLAIFLVGAYQEILGDNHNLFGRTHSADVSVRPNGDFWIHHPLQGDNAAAVLSDVGFNRDLLTRRLRKKITAAEDLQPRQGELLLKTINDALNGYTYLDG